MDDNEEPTDLILKRMGISTNSSEKKADSKGKTTKSQKATNKRAAVDDAELDILKSISSKITETPPAPPPKKKKEKDEYDTLGDYVAMKMRRLATSRSANEMEEIEASIMACLQRPRVPPPCPQQPIHQAQSSDAGTFQPPPAGGMFNHLLMDNYN